MQDPISRVLTTLELLQARDHVSGAELAERLEVDLRTVQRYISKLRGLNIPVDASPGVGGAYRLRPGFGLPPLLLTNEEVFALTLGLRALRQVGLDAFAPATEGAQAKLARVLPAALRDDVQSVGDTVAFARSTWTVSTPGQHLMAVAGAIRTSQQVHFSYRSRADQETRRRVNPYAVLHADGRWYVVGYCLDREELRTFRLDRVLAIDVTATGFARPERFDAEAYLAERLPFLASEYQIDLWIDLSFTEAHGSFALWRVAMEEEGAGTRLRCGRDDLDFFAAVLLSTRRRIVVHQPAELRETFAALALEAARAAGDGGASAEEGNVGGRL